MRSELPAVDVPALLLTVVVGPVIGKTGTKFKFFVLITCVLQRITPSTSDLARHHFKTASRDSARGHVRQLQLSSDGSYCSKNMATIVFAYK